MLPWVSRQSDWTSLCTVHSSLLVLFLLLCSKAVEFSPFWHTSHSVLPCLQNCVRNSPPQYNQYYNRWFQILSSSFCAPHRHPQPPSHSLLHSACTCLCVHRCVVWGIQYYVYFLYFLLLRFLCRHFCWSLKHGVPTFVSEAQHYRNCYCYY